ncbi:hypothetical protein BFJ69_g13267 [Fusarium oxysporum]|uniref:Uncharacterized protein n=1 Tax=Fusarium oxysporum TaxID=5507 RepID=A0A420ML97_FUSOX|nr:hypothetical protein BFJ69_g13267 [Fusarium oxysporum]
MLINYGAQHLGPELSSGIRACGTCTFIPTRTIGRRATLVQSPASMLYEEDPCKPNDPPLCKCRNNDLFASVTCSLTITTYDSE